MCTYSVRQMIRQRIKIVQCNPATVCIESVKPNCHTCGGACPVTIFSGWFAVDSRYTIPTHKTFTPGQEMTLTVDEKQLLGAAVKYYGLPVVALLLGVSIVIPMSLPHPWYDVVAALSGLSAFVLCQFFLWHKAIQPSWCYALTVIDNSKEKK